MHFPVRICVGWRGMTVRIPFRFYPWGRAESIGQNYSFLWRCSEALCFCWRYVEAITQQYHNEKLLVNKQMIKTGFEKIPNLYGLIQAINKKESSSQYLADLEKIRKAYVQDVKENYSTTSIPDSVEESNSFDKNSSKNADSGGSITVPVLSSRRSCVTR